jgi:hypothetical protein
MIRLATFEPGGRYVAYASIASIVLYISMSLLPLLSSGYYSDDLIHSTLKGQLELQNSSFLQYVIDLNREWVTSSGRVCPVHILTILAISYVFSDLQLYKILVLSLTVVNALLFGSLIHVITRNRRVSYLAMLLLPILFQFRLYHDPMLSFFGTMQVFVSLVLCAMIFLYKYLEHNKASALIISLVSYNLALYFYEVSILLLPLFLIIVIGQGHTRVKDALVKIAPYVVSVVVALMAMFAVRQLKSPAAAGYPGIAFSLEPARVFKTFLLQLFASWPLSYYAGNPSHLFHRGLGVFAANVAWQDIAVVVLFITLYLTLIGELTGAERLPVVFLLGSGFMVLPAMLISVSVKYQAELRSFGPGMGYVPVYIQYYGTAFVLTGVIALVLAKLPVNRMRVVGHTVIMVGISMTLLLNTQNNRRVVERANIDLHYRRAALTRALDENILQDLPEHAKLYILDDYTLDPDPSVKSHLRGWASGYHWKNEALVYLYAKKRVHVINDEKDLLSYGRSNGAVDVNDLYLLSIKSYPDQMGIKDGYVVLSSIQSISADKAGKIQIQSSQLRANFPPKT